MAGWVRCRRLAAAEKLRSEATARKAARSGNCISHANHTQITINWTCGRGGRYKGRQEALPMSGNRLTIFDTTLRDGEQAPGFSLRIDEKLKMARQLRTLGVDIIEAGFPIASEADAEAVRMISTHIQGPVIAALARCHSKDIERAGWALSPAPRRRIHVFIATSDLHLERKLRITRDDCLRTAMAAVRQARQYTDDVQFSAEAARRTD